MGPSWSKVQNKDSTGGYLCARLKKVNELIMDNKDAYWTNQYEDESNPIAQRKFTGELLDQMKNKFDFLFVGTGGTIAGCLKEINARGLSTEIIPVDVYGSMIFNSPKGTRKSPEYGQVKSPGFSLQKTSVIWFMSMIQKVSKGVGNC